MRRLLELALAGLVSLEAKAATDRLFRALRAGGLAIAAAIVMGAGVVFVLWGLHVALVPAVGQALAAVLTGILAMIFGLAGLLLARLMLR